MFKNIFLISLLTVTGHANAVNYLDAHYGVEVHLLKAKVISNVLPILFMVENSTGAKVEFKSTVADL